MGWELVLAHLVLPSAVAAVAGFGAWRSKRLMQYARDPRLLRLMWFYGLFAASLIAWAIWTARVFAALGDVALEDLHGAFATGQRVDAFLLAHHALMLASLGVAVRAFGRSHTEDAVVAAIGLAFFGPFVPVVLALEAAMTLYLAVRAILNHIERGTPGALQVAAGFILFFVGHLSFFAFYYAGSGRTPVGDMFALVGLILLVQRLPRPSK